MGSRPAYNLQGTTRSNDIQPKQICLDELSWRIPANEGKWLIKSQNSSGKLVLLNHGKDGSGRTVYMRGLFKFTNSKLLLVAHDFEWPPHFGGAGSKESEFALLVLRRRK